MDPEDEIPMVQRTITTPGPDGQINVYCDLVRSDPKTGEIELYAFVNPVVDGEGGVELTRAAMEAATPDFIRWGAMREMHLPNGTPGTWKVAEWDKKGVRLRGIVIDPLAREKVEKNVYKGGSVGVKPTVWDGKRVVACKWVETSLVDRPKDPDAVFLFARVDGVPIMAPAPGPDPVPAAHEAAPAAAPEATPPEDPSGSVRRDADAPAPAPPAGGITSQTPAFPVRENLEGKIPGVFHYSCGGDDCCGHTTRGGAMECRAKSGEQRADAPEGTKHYQCGAGTCHAHETKGAAFECMTKRGADGRLMRFIEQLVALDMQEAMRRHEEETLLADPRAPCPAFPVASDPPAVVPHPESPSELRGDSLKDLLGANYRHSAGGTSCCDNCEYFTGDGGYDSKTGLCTMYEGAAVKKDWICDHWADDQNPDAAASGKSDGKSDGKTDADDKKRLDEAVDLLRERGYTSIAALLTDGSFGGSLQGKGAAPSSIPQPKDGEPYRGPTPAEHEPAPLSGARSGTEPKPTGPDHPPLQVGEHDAQPANGSETITEAGFADPGYLADGIARYPLKVNGEWNEDRIRAAWKMLHEDETARAGYSVAQIMALLGAIQAAARLLGITIPAYPIDHVSGTLYPMGKGGHPVRSERPSLSREWRAALDANPDAASRMSMLLRAARGESPESPAPRRSTMEVPDEMFQRIEAATQDIQTKITAADERATKAEEALEAEKTAHAATLQRVEQIDERLKQVEAVPAATPAGGTPVLNPQGIERRFPGRDNPLQPTTEGATAEDLERAFVALMNPADDVLERERINPQLQMQRVTQVNILKQQLADRGVFH